MIITYGPLGRLIGSFVYIVWWSGRWSIGSAPQFCAECRWFRVQSSHGDPVGGWDSWNLTFQGIYVLPLSLYYPWSLYYHGLCTTMVYVLPWSMYYHGLCTTMVYVLSLSMYYEHMGRISAACHQNMASWNLPGGPGGPGGPGTLRRSGVTKCC